MTNFEKCKRQLSEFIVNNKDSTPAIVNGKIAHCGDTSCDKCEFSKKRYLGLDCFSRMLLWLCEEYQEPEPTVDWSKVAVDTKVLVSDDGEQWHKRYFAKYENGMGYCWNNGATSWTTGLMEVWEYTKLAEEDAE